MVLLCSTAQTGLCEACRMPAKRANRAATTWPTQRRRLGTPTQRCVVAWPCAAAAACTRQVPQADQRFGSGIKRNAPAISTTARTAVTPTIAAFLPLFASSTCADEARRAQAGGARREWHYGGGEGTDLHRRLDRPDVALAVLVDRDATPARGRRGVIGHAQGGEPRHLPERARARASLSQWQNRDGPRDPRPRKHTADGAPRRAGATQRGAGANAKA